MSTPKKMVPILEYIGGKGIDEYGMEENKKQNIA